MFKEFTGKLRYIRRSTLHFETVRLGLVLCKESLVHKITIVSTVQLNSFTDIGWSNYGLCDAKGLLLSQNGVLFCTCEDRAGWHLIPYRISPRSEFFSQAYKTWHIT